MPHRCLVPSDAARRATAPRARRSPPPPSSASPPAACRLSDSTYRTEPALTRHLLYLLVRKRVTPALSGVPDGGNPEGNTLITARSDLLWRFKGTITSSLSFRATGPYSPTALNYAAMVHWLCGERPLAQASSWMHYPSSAAMSWRSCANRSRRVSYVYNFAGVINFHAFADIAIRLLTATGAGEAREPPRGLAR
jgi:hypothetical protein